MIPLHYLVSTYGYLAVFIGTLLEGETVLVLAGLFAYQGYLNIYWVILLAFLGTLISDQALFFVGRWKGRQVINKYAWLRKRFRAVHRFLEKNPTMTMIAFRFAYGFRTITPLALGTSKVSARRFMFLNIVTAFVWAAAFGALGYLLGGVLQLFLGRMHMIELQILAAVVIASIVLHLANRRRHRNRPLLLPGSRQKE